MLRSLFLTFLLLFSIGVSSTGCSSLLAQVAHANTRQDDVTQKVIDQLEGWGYDVIEYGGRIWVIQQVSPSHVRTITAYVEGEGCAILWESTSHGGTIITIDCL